MQRLGAWVRTLRYAITRFLCHASAGDLAANLASPTPPMSTARATGAALILAGLTLSLPPAPSPALLPKLCALLGLALLALALLPPRRPERAHDNLRDDEAHDETGTASISHEDHTEHARTEVCAPA